MASRTLSDLKRPDLFQQKGFIGDQWVDSLSGATFEVRNPATLETLATIPEMGAADTEKAIRSAHEAFQSYKKTTARQRARWLRRWNDLCLEHTDDLALILTLENGKTLNESRGEVIYAASFLEWFAGEAERTHGDVVPAANPNQRIMTIKQPIGVAACLTPWNFPVAMITRKVGAALAAGCTTVWKPAGETPLSALAQAVLAREAGFPAGSINVITTLDKVSEVGTALCTAKLVRKLSFTGSTRVGKLLAEQSASNVKKLSLELGGNSPFIVFDDARVDIAVEACIMAKTRNAGQTCVSANRILVQDGIYDQFSATLVDRLKQLKVGLGTQDGVSIGPLTHERAVQKALAHIKDAKSRGATVLLGGDAFQPNNLPGYFIQPTILGGVPTGTITDREETFAPVVALQRFRTEEEALEMANNCDVGLGSYIMTENTARMWRVAESLEVGMVAVNLGAMSACESPFGGVKESGTGREGGRQGIEEYLTVQVEDRPVPQIQRPTDAILKVTSTALCGSDLHFYRGHLKCPTDFICGHEFVGEVVELGSDVKGLSVGDKVVAPFYTACLECYNCVRGQASRCLKGELFGNSAPANTIDGGQAEYVRVPLAATTLVKSPQGIPEEQLVLMADIFPTGYFAAARFLKDLDSRDREEFTTVVIGCGPVGICAITAALTMVKTVYAIDSVPERLAEAEKIGAIPINLNDNPIDKIKAATDGRGADVVLEVVGHADAFMLGFNMIKPWGKISSVGVHTEELPLNGLLCYGKNITMAFGRCPVRSIFEEALSLLVKEQDKVAFLCKTIMPLEDAPQAYKDFEARKIHKVVFKV
ncbi:hypothetical protein DV736_g4325, partial [Chaetothyriales sp. CBS 134916]